MKNRFKNIFVSVLAIVLTVILTSEPQDNSFAKEYKKGNMEKGVQEINEQVKDLKKSKIERHEKLDKDFPIFKEKGTAKIDEDNLFYIKNKTGFTKDELDYVLSGTELEGLGEAFEKAEEEYSVNSIFLMAVAKHESGNGTSYLAREKNNLFGFNAIDSDPINAATHFKSKDESIEYVAKFLSENYLDPEGKFYNGVSTDAINISYATDLEWSNKVEGHMIEIANKLEEYNVE